MGGKREEEECEQTLNLLETRFLQAEHGRPVAQLELLSILILHLKTHKKQATSISLSPHFPLQEVADGKNAFDEENFTKKQLIVEDKKTVSKNAEDKSESLVVFNKSL